MIEDYLKHLESLTEWIIQQYFPDEQNTSLILYFRSYPQLIGQLLPQYVSDTSEQSLNIASEPLVYNQAANAETAYLKNTSINLANLSDDESTRKINKFSMIFMYEALQKLDLNDAQKLHNYKQYVIGLKRFEMTEGDHRITELVRDRLNFVNHEIEILEDKLHSKVVTNTISGRESHVIWSQDAKTLNLLIEAMKIRGIIIKKTPLENIFNGGNELLQIERDKFELFVWLLHKLHENRCYRISGTKGHFSHFETLIDWDYCNRPTKVPFRKIVHKLKSTKGSPNPILAVVSAILKESQITGLK